MSDLYLIGALPLWLIALVGLVPVACGGKGGAGAATAGDIRLSGAVKEPRTWSVDGLATLPLQTQEVSFLGEGMRAGYACQDGAALHFRGTDLHRVVSSRPGAAAYHVACVDGTVIETPLAADYLGEASAAPALADALAA